MILRTAICLSMLPICTAQGPILDVLDGETLYESGFLLTLGTSLERRDTMRSGSQRVDDPQAAHESELVTTLGLQFGLRNDLQLGIALPYVDHDRHALPLALPGGGGGGGAPLLDQAASGLGDLTLLAKYRFWRQNGPGFATNYACITGVSLPTGEDDQRQGFTELEPEMQPGSGGIDPMLGVAVTHEPGRWRFNAAALHHWHTDSDGDGDRLGNEWTAELSVGNRFWLEPYPGPFMRLDAVLRYHHEDRAEQDGELPDTGGNRYTAGLNLAFRPRPSLDLQLYAEAPIHEEVNGTQLASDWGLQLTLGYRF
jgi:hypothetical protein